MTDLQTLFSPPSDPGLLVYGHYSAPLVLLAIGVAVFASWMALQMAGQARQAASRGLRVTALCTGSLALGAGVWAMHFVGMLAFDLCTGVSYEPALTLWSMLPSLGASFVALWLMAQPRVSRAGLWGGAVLVGLGIGAMHYAGMAAMRMALSLHYDLPTFGLSIAVAVLLAHVALGVRFGWLGQWLPLSPGQRGVVAALVMGCAISGMHFMGMAAARFAGAADAASAGHDSMLALQVCLMTAAFTAAVAALNGWLRYREMFRRVRAHEARERSLLAVAADGVITLDEQGAVVDFNPAAERLFGLGRAQALGRDVGSLLVETDAGKAAPMGAAASITGRSAEMRAQCGDGSELMVRAVFSPRQQVGGDQCVVFVRDISAHKAVQQALAESERQLRSLVDSIPGIAYRVQAAPGLPLLYMSEGIERILGYAAADFTGPRPLRSLAGLILADDRPQVLAEIRAAGGEKRPHLVEFRARRADGRICWLWSNGRTSYDAAGRTQWIDGVIMDITGRKEAELALQHFSALVEDSGDAIFATTADGVLTSWNKGAERIWGYSAEEALGRRSADLMANPAAPHEPAALRRQVMTGGRVVQQLMRRRRRDGSLIDIAATISPIRAPDGSVIGISMISRDVTDRLRMEADLRAAKEAAERAAEARTAFLANMSHEIRTPMNAVLGFTEVLLDSPLDARQRRHLDIIRDSGRSLLHLLNEVLDLAKLDRGAMQLDESDFSLLALIDRLTSTMAHQARAKGLMVTVQYAQDLGPAFHGDEQRLRQVLINLLGNAIKFTAAGSVTLSVTRGSDPRSPVLHFTVRDTGIGIAPERLAAIFDPFTQADASMSRRYGGTGLGTTIAKQLTELMGGRIWAESTPGEGSAFHVLLPLEAARAPLPAQRGAPLPQLRPLRLLAVDDVPQNLELLTLLLEGHGHTVLHAGGGAQAVRRVAEEHFDALLMDVHMPEMDGLEATRLIRAAEAQRGAPRVPVVALTASVQETDLIAARAAGMDGFAAKPVELQALLAELARVLGVEQAPGNEATTSVAATPKAALPAWVAESEMAARTPAGSPAAPVPLSAALGEGSATPGKASAEAGTAWARLGGSGAEVVMGEARLGERGAKPVAAGMRPAQGDAEPPAARPWPAGSSAAPGAAEPRPTESSAALEGVALRPGESNPEPVLDYAAGLRRCGGKEASYLRLLGSFATHYGGSAQTIVALAAAGDPAGAAAAAHKLRGVAANLGLQALWKLSGALEEALQATAPGAQLASGTDQVGTQPAVDQAGTQPTANQADAQPAADQAGTQLAADQAKPQTAASHTEAPPSADQAGARTAAHQPGAQPAVETDQAGAAMPLHLLQPPQLRQQPQPPAAAATPPATTELARLLALLPSVTAAALQAITTARAVTAPAAAPPRQAAGGDTDADTRTRELGAALLRSFARGELNEAALARLLAALGDAVEPAGRAGLKQALDNFDFPLACRRLEALLAECGTRRAESTP